MLAPRVGIHNIPAAGLEGSALSKPVVPVQGMLRNSHA